jgi:hypothetical protein
MSDNVTPLEFLRAVYCNEGVPLDKRMKAAIEAVGLIKQEEADLPPGATSLDLLRAIYRDPGQPLATRMRAAALAIGYEHPKLSITANNSAIGFASRLEANMRRLGHSPSSTRLPSA